MVILVWARIPTRGQTVTADHSRMGSAMMLSLHCFSPPGVRSSLFVKVGECLYALVGGSMWCLLIICAIDGEWYSVGASELEWRICRRESMVFMYTIDMDHGSYSYGSKGPFSANKLVSHENMDPFDWTFCTLLLATQCVLYICCRWTLRLSVAKP